MKFQLDRPRGRGTEDLKAQFGLTEGQNLFLCHSLAHAVTEAVKGLAQLFPHKTSIAIRRDTSPHVENIAKGFSRDGLQAVSMVASDVSDFDGAIAKMGKNTLLYIAADDDVLTGEIFYNDEFEKKLSDQKIFSLRIASDLFHKPLALNPYSIWIHEISEDLVLTAFGERVVMERLFFPLEGEFYASLQTPQEAKEDKAAIINFEKSCQAFAKTPLYNKANRLYDRAVLMFEDVDGSALRDLLLQDVKGLEPHLIETSSLCRWGRLKGVEWLYHQGYTPEQVRGLVVISSQTLGRELTQNIEGIYRKIKRLQEGV